jgi:predicted amidohydrolase YtcJ
MEISGITPETKVNGGDIFLKYGKPTGILIDNAIELVSQRIPEPDKEQIAHALLSAQKKCFAAGLTGVYDAGLEKQVIDVIDSLDKSGDLQIRIYAMLSPTRENFEAYLNKGIYKTDRLNVRSVKLYADGALGSRGAKLLKDYTDDPGNNGLLLRTPQSFREIIAMAYEKGFQVNTHAIGDSANRLVLTLYGEVLKGKNDRRWRIEHAQVVAPEDFELFGKYSIVPSVQPTHATSDMYWAGERLGPERLKTAYAYKRLLKQSGWLPLGTDFPVENINPLYTFYAAVARKDLKGWPENGFQTENALTRKEALYGMTVWAARSGFEENEKGSLEPGKFADFVVLDKDIMEIPENEIPATGVLKTYIGGVEVFGLNEKQ